jgi:hypothetical protein
MGAHPYSYTSALTSYARGGPEGSTVAEEVVAGRDNEALWLI